MLLDIDIHLVPKAAIIPDFLAPRANGNEAAQGFNFGQSVLKFFDETFPFCLGLFPGRYVHPVKVGVTGL
jgi:hypothetical protein